MFLWVTTCHSEQPRNSRQLCLTSRFFCFSNALFSTLIVAILFIFCNSSMKTFQILLVLNNCFVLSLLHTWPPPYGSDGKDTACNLGDPDLIPGWGRSPGEGNGNPLQYSCLENSMDRGAWWATDHGIAKIWTWLSYFHFHRSNLVFPYDIQQHILPHFIDVSLFFCPWFIFSIFWGWGYKSDLRFGFLQADRSGRQHT